MNKMTSAAILLSVAVMCPSVSAGESAFNTLFTAKQEGKKTTLAQCHADLIAWNKAWTDTTYTTDFTTEELYRRSGEALTCMGLMMSEAKREKDLVRKNILVFDASAMNALGSQFQGELLSRAEGIMIDHDLGPEFLLKK